MTERALRRRQLPGMVGPVEGLPALTHDLDRMPTGLSERRRHRHVGTTFS